MSRTRNANEFLIALRKINYNYELLFKQKVDEIRRVYSNNPTGKTPPNVDDSLEAHVRCYIINQLLQSLNWRLDCSPTEGLPNMIPEAPVYSTSTGTTRFLDYLGLEMECEKPLLIVEAKRPNIALPQPREKKEKFFNTATLISEAIKGDADCITHEWYEFLMTLQDYARTSFERTGFVPKRIVMTNGDWLILFTDPESIFINEKPDSGKISVWANRNEIEQRYFELYREMEYSSVLGKQQEITLSDLLFYIQPESITYMMHGIRLAYFEDPTMYLNVKPRIQVSPLVLLGTQVGTWLKVEKPIEENTFTLPHSYRELSEHLNSVKDAGVILLHDVNELLSSTLEPTTITYHYRSQDSLDSLKGVNEEFYHADLRLSVYIIVTGNETHYIKEQPSVYDCPYHEWSNCQQQGYALSQPINIRTTNSPRSFFIDNEPHHCAHKGVENAKASCISDVNRERCGPRSGEIGCAFCELYSIDNLLCCRTCFLEEVCTSMQAFTLPCEIREE